MHCDVADPLLVLAGVVVCLGLATGARLVDRGRVALVPPLFGLAAAALALVVIGLRLPAGCATTEPADARQVVAGQPVLTPAELTGSLTLRPRPDGLAALTVDSDDWPRGALVNVSLCTRFELPVTAQELYEEVPDRCLGVLAQGVADVTGELAVTATVALADEVRLACAEGCMVLLADMESLRVVAQPLALG
jgi:hypothetical protein